MKKLFFASLALALAVACSDDSDGRYPSSELLQKALLERYPSAVNVEWGTRGGYIIADFEIPSTADLDYQAWFSSKGVWYMTESDMLYGDLPAAVRQSFESGYYAQWRVEEVDKLERESAPTLYVVEAEGLVDGVEQDMELFYTADGELVKEVAGGDSSYEEFIPRLPNEGIKMFISQNYPDSQILDVERKGSSFEVEILDEKSVRSLLFDMHDKWVRTLTEIHPNDVPQGVLDAIGDLYTSYRIDEVDFVQTPNAEYYLVEIESGPQEVLLKITPAGEIL
jgi:hypothetical protein